MKNILKITLVAIGVFFIANQAMAIRCICETQVRQAVDDTNPYSAGATIPVTKKVETICPGDSCNSCSKEMYSNRKPLAGNAPAKTEPAKPATFTPNVPIGGQFIEGAKIKITNNLLSEYIKTWYNFIIGAIGILATVMIMYGGLKWLTSRGNSAVISNAKEKIFSALIGLVLVFLSYTILYLVNPNLVNIKPLDISTIEPKEIQLNYSYTDPTTNDNVRITDIGLDLAESDGGTIRPGETAADAIARNARSAIGVSTSRVPGTDEGRLACAYSVNEIVRNALGQPINTSLGTANVYNTLDQDNDYILTENAHQNLGDNYSNLQPGDIIISPTGDDRLSRENGHVGIYIGDGEIVSNASTQATIAAPYNVQQWIERYGFFDTFRHQ